MSRFFPNKKSKIKEIFLEFLKEKSKNVKIFSQQKMDGCTILNKIYKILIQSYSQLGKCADQIVTMQNKIFQFQIETCYITQDM